MLIFFIVPKPSVPPFGVQSQSTQRARQRESFYKKNWQGSPKLGRLLVQSEFVHMLPKQKKRGYFTNLIGIEYSLIATTIFVGGSGIHVLLNREYTPSRNCIQSSFTAAVRLSVSIFVGLNIF